MNDKNGLYAWESYLANIQSAYDPTSPEPPASSLAAWNRLTYTGHEFDPETGLYYFKARFYDPELGRFASADPYLGDSLTPPSLHRYLYAYANPLTFVDLTGYLAYRYFGRETGNGQERPYVVAEIETEDVYRHPIHSILSGYRFEDIAQQNAFLNELGRLNPGIVSVDSQGRAGWDLEVLGRAGQAVRLPVSADYRLTDAATAEIVAESGGATNMDEWRRHQLARQVPQAVRQRVQTTVNMARKTAARLVEWSQDSAETLTFGPYKMGAESVAVAEWAGRMSTEYGRQEFSGAVYRKLEYLLRTEAGAEDVSATLLALCILGRITPPSAEHTWLKLESPGSLKTAGQVASKEGLNPLEAGQQFEAEQLKSLGVHKNTNVWRPSQVDIDSATFKTIVGPAKHTKGGQNVGTIIDSTQGQYLEIKGGSSTLESSYQLRLQVYRSLKENIPFTIRTTRPINPVFRDWLTRWGVIIDKP